MYWQWDNFTLTSGQQLTIPFNDPSIQQLMTDFSSRAYWEGMYWTGNPVMPHNAAFCFQSDGSYRYYVDGRQQGTGSYNLGSRGTYFTTFNVTGHVSSSGMLYEPYGMFDMKNGPADWRQITYQRDALHPNWCP